MSDLETMQKRHDELVERFQDLVGKAMHYSGDVEILRACKLMEQAMTCAVVCTSCLSVRKHAEANGRVDELAPQEAPSTHAEAAILFYAIEAELLELIDGTH